MVGALLTLLFCAALCLWVLPLLDNRRDLDPALRTGLSGLLGLGGCGTITLFVWLLPHWISRNSQPFSAASVSGSTAEGERLLADIVFGLVVAVAAFFLSRMKRRTGGITDYVPTLPQGREWLFALPLGLALAFAAIGTLAPADAVEWDSLAYHLAVPKLWLLAGRIYYIPFIHHSNFPFAIDDLNMWGLTWGGQPGAKAFILASAIFGAMAIFGLARQVYGRAAANWAVLIYATCPVVLWLSGTAYIDVPNGLFAGLGIGMAALYARSGDRRDLWLAGGLLGFALGSKYTGLQTLFVVGLVLVLLGLKRKSVGPAFVSVVLMGALALAIACPWYIKNVAWTGNPVYPFFYGKLRGRNWSAERSKVYSHEQQTFGVGTHPGSGKHDVDALGHAVLGLAYQPGRYINPGQEQGGGVPLGAIGVPVLAIMLAWAYSGRARTFETFCLISAGVSLLMWFFLSQQSRYIVTLAVPLSVIGGGGILRLRAGPFLAALAVIQAAYSLFLQNFALTSQQMPVVFGQMPVSTYLEGRIPFYQGSQAINERVPKTGKVALYDEVFGYLLDVPYFWANPGHTNVIPYERMSTGEQYADEMERLGFTHVYLNLSPTVRAPEDARKWMASMGLQVPGPGYTQAEHDQQMGSFEQKFVALITDAVKAGRLRPLQGVRGGLLLEFQKVTSPGSESTHGR